MHTFSVPQILKYIFKRKLYLQIILMKQKATYVYLKTVHFYDYVFKILQNF